MIDEQMDTAESVQADAEVEAEGHGVWQPRPGALHPVDESFYKLAIQQRDRAWRAEESLQAALARSEAQRKQVEEAVREALAHVEEQGDYAWMEDKLRAALSSDSTKEEAG